MKNISQHTIQQINIEVNTSNEQKAHELKDESNGFLKEVLLPKLELLLDQLETPDKTKRFDTINLEISMKRNETLNSSVNQLVNQLMEKIAVAEVESAEPGPGGMRTDYSGLLSEQKDNFRDSEKSGLNPGRAKSSGKRADMENSFLYFLDSGQLPWYSKPSLIEDFTRPDTFAASLRNDLFLLKIKQLFLSAPHANERFVRQFGDEIIEALIRRLAEAENIHLDELQAKISEVSQNLKDSLYKLIIHKLIQVDFQDTQLKYQQLYHEIETRSQSEKKANDQIRQILRLFDSADPDFENRLNNNQPNMQITASLTAEKLSDKKEPSQTTENAGQKSQYVQNAGLILAHPFLWDLFSRTQCTDGKSSLLPEKKQLAVHLLHYLATGQEHEMEYNLSFEKFLCALPPDEPIDRKLSIPETDKAECNDLLQSIIRHWPALKNTSPDGLRQMFIQRDGKLDLRKIPYKLSVERKAQDILLDQLQWSIAIVKLPWTKDLLFTEW